MNYKICFTPEAEKDLLNAEYFYSKINLALGQYCVDSLMLVCSSSQVFTLSLVIDTEWLHVNFLTLFTTKFLISKS